MSAPVASTDRFDVFLSHHSHDKPWVRSLRDVPADDLRRLALGQMLAFDLRRGGDTWQVVGPDNTARSALSPLADAAFVGALSAFRRLVRTPVTADADRADLTQAATAVGR